MKWKVALWPEVAAIFVADALNRCDTYAGVWEFTFGVQALIGVKQAVLEFLNANEH